MCRSLRILPPFLIVAALGIAWLGAYLWQQYRGPVIPSQPVADQPGSGSGVPRMAVARLQQELEAFPEAKKQYEGKQIEVTGVVVGVVPAWHNRLEFEEKGANHTWLLELASGAEVKAFVSCRFRDYVPLEQIQPGQVVTVAGTIDTSHYPFPGQVRIETPAVRKSPR